MSILSNNGYILSHDSIMTCIEQSDGLGLVLQLRKLWDPNICMTVEHDHPSLGRNFTPLTYAIFRGDTFLVSLLVDEFNINVHQCVGGTDSVFEATVNQANFEVLRTLVDRGLFSNLTDEVLLMMLATLLPKPDQRWVQLFLEKVQYQHLSKEVMSLACNHSSAYLLRQMLDRGCDMDVVQSSGDRILHIFPYYSPNMKEILEDVLKQIPRSRVNEEGVLGVLPLSISSANINISSRQDLYSPLLIAHGAIER